MWQMADDPMHILCLFLRSGIGVVTVKVGQSTQKSLDDIS